MSYAPASPDLSSFYSGSTSTQTTSTTATQIGRTGPLAPSAPSSFSLPVSPTPTIHQSYTHYHQQQPYQQQRREYIGAQFPSHHSPSHLDAHHQPAYSPKSPVSSPSGPPCLPQQTQALNLHSPQSPQPPRAPLQPASLNLNQVASPVQTLFHSSYDTSQPQPFYQLEPPPQTSSFYAAPQQNFTQQPADPNSTGHLYQLEHPPHIKSEQEYHFLSETKDQKINMPPRRSTAAAVQPPPVDPSPVKTRFPTARIKRIMQADEEVGKVAQQTPIAVGKALELFMVALVSKSHDIAKDKGAKRVTAQHLKQVVESDDQWDFLREIVGRVSETEDKAKAGRAKAESSSDEEQQVEVKKKGRGGRKKKTA
ncbi:DNA polymerase epsilon subunit C [Magnaporthiopsis poae ATCC 64411]|uniref:NCT transcriptional regulatory complex subunit A n=1 Tax=Magnaporthiopsis poae (strain ATCC 64411 / 73-15) TaxID=644358 RepID=A0A0C4DTK7_MAGP6|nr:DNA polymerase epsilon subunit C [Magnaporthiopsis poae ATCC 64411]